MDQIRGICGIRGCVCFCKKMWIFTALGDSDPLDSLIFTVLGDSDSPDSLIFTLLGDSDPPRSTQGVPGSPRTAKGAPTEAQRDSK